jgi:hypothetical protein
MTFKAIFGDFLWEKIALHRKKWKRFVEILTKHSVVMLSSLLFASKEFFEILGKLKLFCTWREFSMKIYEVTDFRFSWKFIIENVKYFKSVFYQGLNEPVSQGGLLCGC